MPLNGWGIWNERPIPMRQAGARAPSRVDVGAGEDHAPQSRAASFRWRCRTAWSCPRHSGPMMPSASPSSSARSISCATTMAPNRLETFSNARIGGTDHDSSCRLARPSESPSRSCWWVMTRFELCRPCAATGRQPAAVLVTFFTGLAGPLHRADDRLVVGRDHGIENGLGLQRLRTLEHVDCHLEQRGAGSRSAAVHGRLGRGGHRRR